MPYNSYLLMQYDCHINVEICYTIKAIKYLYKYIYKYHKRVVDYVTDNKDDVLIDKIQQFQDARWLSSQEVVWKIFEFELNEIYATVINLQLHFPNKQVISFEKIKI